MTRSGSLRWSVLLLLGACALQGVVQSREVVCYYGSWATYRNNKGAFPVTNIDYSLCTQLNYAFFDIDPTGSVRITDEHLALLSGLNAIAKFTNLKHRKPAMKILAAVGGRNAGTANFATVAASPQLRANFAKEAVAFLLKYHFDGMDIDWEYPTSSQKADFVLFLKELADAFAPYRFFLTVAVAATEATANDAYDIPAISGIVNYINLMAYDMEGNYGVARHHSPLYAGSASVDDTDVKRQSNVEASVKYWLSKGAPAAKLNLGIPFYGRSFKLADSNNDAVGAATLGNGGFVGPYTNQPGLLGYNEICEKSWAKKEFDPVQVAAYASGGGDWVTYDSVQSIYEKCNLISQYKLGGGTVWSIDMDDFLGTCGQKFELLTTLNECVNIPAPVVRTTTTTTTTPAPTTRKSVDCTGVVFGIFVDPTDCTAFIICYADEAFPGKCVTGFKFSERYETCISKNGEEC